MMTGTSLHLLYEQGYLDARLMVKGFNVSIVDLAINPQALEAQASWEMEAYRVTTSRHLAI